MGEDDVEKKLPFRVLAVAEGQLGAFSTSEIVGFHSNVWLLSLY